MNLIPTCFNYKGHTIYSDGRVYKHYMLIREKPYATEAAAKAAATRNQRKWLQQHYS